MKRLILSKRQRTQVDRLAEGVVRRTPSEKPLQLLVGSVIHVLKDVAIAPTFRSGI